MVNLNQIPTEELKRELQQRNDKRNNILANIIRIAGNISTITVDCLDDYCAIDQFKAELSKCLEEIKTKMGEL